MSETFQIQLESCPVVAQTQRLSVGWVEETDDKLLVLYGSRELAMIDYCRLRALRARKRRRAKYWINQSKKWSRRNLRQIMREW